ncbi:MAG: restriction endonuclease subunit S [Gammaproteobacteria bacterium]|nr:restriction endonuclease subunit S [Gammaproteobacteria bacterium]
MTRAAKALTPKLRFPEFREWPKWDLLTLSSASDVNPKNGGLPKQFIYIDLESVKNGALIERKEISRDAAPSRAQRLLSRKDIIYQTVRPYQRNNLFFDIDDGHEYVASTGYAQIRAYGSPRFLYQLLHTDSFVRSVLARCTGSNYPAINPSALASIEVLLPKEGEQRKIADCLGSLDDLIAAEGRKLEALRQHKKGLMQQLFPQPGETAPRLRFPEFRETGDWRRNHIGSVASIAKGKGLSKADIESGGAIPCIRYAEIYTHYGEVIHEVVSSTNAPKKNLMLSQAEDVIVPASGETKTDIAKAACVLAEGVALGSDLNVLRSDLYGPFFSYLLNSPLRHQIARIAQGDTVAHLYPKQISQVELAYPSHLEQQKIAECLGSLDALIAAGGRKLEALRQHKRGLMQQLFPNPKEGHA